MPPVGQMENGDDDIGNARLATSYACTCSQMMDGKIAVTQCCAVSSRCISYTFYSNTARLLEFTLYLMQIPVRVSSGMTMCSRNSGTLSFPSSAFRREIAPAGDTFNMKTRTPIRRKTNHGKRRETLVSLKSVVLVCFDLLLLRRPKYKVQ